MKIGIIVAMEKEMELLLPVVEEPVKEHCEGYDMIRGIISGHEVMVMHCGIGKVNAAVGTKAMADLFSPDIVINTGVAGGADLSMHVLDVLIADGVAYHDVWCGPGTEYGAAAGCPGIFLPEISAAVRDKINGEKIKYGLICSGDKFITSAAEIDYIKSNFPEALAVDMESAAIAQVCYLKRLPFMIIRVISDTPGAEENISQYCNFWNDAPRQTFGILTDVLDIIGK